MADSDIRAEIGALAAALRAHIEVEDELGGHGLLPHKPGEGRAPAPVAAPNRLETPPASKSEAPVPAAGQRVEVSDKRMRLEQLASEAAACTACALHEKRTRSVFARGNVDAELVFVGEGPGRDEDLAGLPFVGAAGQLLDRMVDAMGFDRDEVYICNIVKCRPPENRTPLPEEAITCSRFLIPQLELVSPKLIVALGRCAAENLGVAPPGGGWRGRWGSFRGVPVMPTYHPAYLLRSPEYKRVVWEDLQLVLGRMGRTPRARAGR